MLQILIKDSKKSVLKDGEIISIDDFTSIYDVALYTNNLINRLESDSFDGKKIHELYSYDGIEMYNFSRGVLCLYLGDVIEIILFIKYIIEKFPQEKILIETDRQLVKDIYKYVFEQDNKIEVVVQKNRDKRHNNRYFKKVYRILKGFIYYYKFIFLKKKNKNNMLMLTQAADINSITINDNQQYYDAKIGKVYKALREKYNLFIMQYMNTDSALKNQYKIEREVFPFENFILLKKFNSKKLFNSSNITNNLGLLNEVSFEVAGYDISNLMKNLILKKLESSMISYIYEINMATILLRKLKIDKIIVTDEADRIRCLIYAANKLNIDTYAIQHGIIAEVSNSYLIPSEDVQYVPKKTFLWGESFKKLLTSKTKVYNDNNLVVVGQPRTDFLIEKIEKEHVNKNNNDKLKILYATQYFWDLTEEATKIFFEALKDIKEYEVIIKLHPNDKYESFYKELVQEYNLDNVKITKTMDIYDCLIWCDLVISVHSTVVLEGAILNKPSICILLKKYYDHGNFVKNKISIGVESTSELIEYLKNRNFNSSNKSNYLKESFYKIDGKVWRRIVREIEN